MIGEREIILARTTSRFGETIETLEKKTRSADGAAMETARPAPARIGERSVMHTLLVNRRFIAEFWVKAIFSVILAFCVFQLGMSIYQADLGKPVKKLHAISAFAS